LLGMHPAGVSISFCEFNPPLRSYQGSDPWFVSYNMLKKRASGGDSSQALSAGSYLLCSAQASSQFLSPMIIHVISFSNPDWHLGAVTAVMTNPIWVVKVRMFTTRADSPTSYRNLWGIFSLRSLPLQRLIPRSFFRRSFLHNTDRGHLGPVSRHFLSSVRCQQWSHPVHGV